METRNSAPPQTASFHSLTQNFITQVLLYPPPYSLEYIKYFLHSTVSQSEHLKKSKNLADGCLTAYLYC